MNKTFIAVFLCSILFACNSAETTQEQGTSEVDHTEQVSQTVVPEETTVQDTANAPLFDWEEEQFSFGTIDEGEEVTHTYLFTNVGKSPLIISDVRASCGCTTPEFTTDPVKPGETGSITVVFDSAGQRGKQQKIISILSNAHPKVSMVQLKGEVKEST